MTIPCEGFFSLAYIMQSIAYHNNSNCVGHTGIQTSSKASPTGFQTQRHTPPPFCRYSVCSSIPFFLGGWCQGKASMSHSQRWYAGSSKIKVGTETLYIGTLFWGNKDPLPHLHPPNYNLDLLNTLASWTFLLYQYLCTRTNPCGPPSLREPVNINLYGSHTGLFWWPPHSSQKPSSEILL